MKRIVIVLLGGVLFTTATKAQTAVDQTKASANAKTSVTKAQTNANALKSAGKLKVASAPNSNKANAARLKLNKGTL
jgi:hypothetical protein